MGMMDTGQNNPYAVINPFAAFINEGLKGYKETEQYFQGQRKDEREALQQAALLRMKQDEADRLNEQAIRESKAQQALSERISATKDRPIQTGLLSQGDMQGMSMMPQQPMQQAVDPASMKQPMLAGQPMTQQDWINHAAQYADTPTGKTALQIGSVQPKESFAEKLIATGKYDPASVVEFLGGKGQLRFAKDPSVVTWSEPFTANVGGKKALVQQSSTGQIKPVIEDKSTTVVMNGDRNKPGRVLPAAQLETIADMRKVKETLENASGILSGGNVSTGPVSGRLQSLGSMVGLTSDRFNDAKQQLSTAENIMLKLRSGAAVTEPEFKRFKNEYPSVNDSPSVRDRKMANAIKYANDLMDTKLQVFQDGGYKIPESAYSKEGPVPKLKGQAPIGKVGKYSYTVSK